VNDHQRVYTADNYKMMRSRLLIFFLLLLICFSIPAFAQSNLFRKITIDKIDHQRFGVVLQKVASKGEFTFA